MLPVSGNPIYYVEDLLGTSRVMTTNTGVVCYDADFYPYGGERAPYTNTCTQNNYKFEGKERDTETGNDDFGARYYSNRFGRWLSADWSAVPVPVPYANFTNPQTLNLYSMVADDPESFADLDGHVTDPNGPPAEGGTCKVGSLNCNKENDKLLAEQEKNKPAQPSQEKKDDKPKEGGVQAPPAGPPKVPPPPPGIHPDGKLGPNEWEKIPGTDGQKYGPEYKPKFPVP